MKFIIIVFLLLIESTAQAQIFKCVDAKGRVVYRDMACSDTVKQKKVIVRQFDPGRILEAQKKLETEIQHQQKLKVFKALQSQAQNNERLRKSAQEYTDVTKDRGYRNDYYDLPEYNELPRWQSNPAYDSSKQKSGLDMDIRMK